MLIHELFQIKRQLFRDRIKIKGGVTILFFAQITSPNTLWVISSGSAGVFKLTRKAAGLLRAVTRFLPVTRSSIVPKRDNVVDALTDANGPKYRTRLHKTLI